ncbi:MAG: hypothetical protein ACRDK7_15510 [Solirubrobacteraceae bacterium]
MIRRVAILVAFVSVAVCVPSAQAAVTVESFSAEAASTVAGAHADATTAFAFQTMPYHGEIVPAGGDPQDIVINLPPGLVGDPSNVPKCPRFLFAPVLGNSSGEGCPANTQVGVAALHFWAGFVLLRTVHWGVYNLQPGPNEPALLGIQGIVNADQVSIPIKLTASAKNAYALTATVSGVPEAPVEAHTLSAIVTVWGVPAAHSRGAGGSNSIISESNVESEPSLGPAPSSEWKPFMENPTDCAETPLTSLSVDTYQEPEVFTDALAESPMPTDCASVPFAPSIKAEPDTTQAGAPAGLDFELTVPQNNGPEEQGEAELEKAVVTLPQGMTVSPSAASKLLEGCTDEQFGAGSDAPATCPPASVIGEDEVESPLLSGPLKGKVYLGQPLSTEPESGQMFRVFQELKGFGLDIKLHGSVVANPQTGQLTATFANLPELPFQTFKLHFNSGPNAVLVNPATCGPHTTTTQLYPYSDPTSPATPPSTFDTSYDGGACPAALPFAPLASISTASSQAGATSPFSVTFSRADESQPLGQIDATLPEGLLGYVSKVPLCEAPAALAGTCGPGSRIGTVSTSAGAGEDPLTVGGSVYLARGTAGYPFMLSVVVPAVAGPYDLGNVVVPVYLQVNSDGSITAVSGPLPSILDGIPLDIRSVTMTIDRPGFTLNPTNCGPLSLTGLATSLSGATAALSAPFSVSGCAILPFKPSFTVATAGSTSKANGASLTVRVSQRSGEADIHYVHVELPKSLPSRLTTLQKACTEAQFAVNPAGCPKGSFVGTATAYTPLLSNGLSGPAIFVSHGGAAFPDLDIVLQGEGITIVLTGNTDIKDGITSSTFAAVPDVPISGFELSLPEGPYSALTATGKLCEQKLTMPTTIVGQNGVTVKQSTRIAVTGCVPVKVSVKKAKVKSGKLMLTVKASAAGLLKVTGADVKTIHKRVSAGTHQLAVALSAKGRVAGRHRKRIKLRVRLQAPRKAVATTTRVQL